VKLSRSELVNVVRSEIKSCLKEMAMRDDGTFDDPTHPRADEVLVGDELAAHSDMLAFQKHCRTCRDPFCEMCNSGYGDPLDNQPTWMDEPSFTDLVSDEELTTRFSESVGHNFEHDFYYATTGVGEPVCGPFEDDQDGFTIVIPVTEMSLVELEVASRQARCLAGQFSPARLTKQDVNGLYLWGVGKTTDAPGMPPTEVYVYSARGPLA
jgi:hypothetical protein